MSISKFTKRVATYISGRALKMFRMDCYNSGMNESEKIKQIVAEHYAKNPPFGFKKQTSNQ